MAVELVNLTALLVTIIMLKSGELAFNTPLSAMVLRGFCMTIDQVRGPMLGPFTACQWASTAARCRVSA